MVLNTLGMMSISHPSLNGVIRALGRNLGSMSSGSSNIFQQKAAQRPKPRMIVCQQTRLGQKPTINFEYC